jgi:hypothetical protein
MISKVITGKSFGGVCRYILSDQKRAVVLHTEGVRSHDYKLMAADFKSQQALRPMLSKAVFHGILSFYPGEEISDDKMVQISKEYLLKLGITDTQFAIAKHLDKSHAHVHIIANLVNNKGQTIKDSWIGLRGKKVAQQLTLNHGLKQALSKDLKLSHLDKLNGKDQSRYVIFRAISETLSHCRNLNDLSRYLSSRNIETLYKFKGQTNELQGISFRFGDYKFKGSEIDRNFSINRLQRTLQQNKYSEVMQHIPTRSYVAVGIKESNLKEYENEQQHVLSDLMKPERIHEQIPAQWNIKKPKKRKSNNLHL